MKTLQKHKPQTAKIVPWEEIEKRYIDLISNGLKLESILALVQFIRTNQLDKRLFAYTSMAKLVITIYNPAEWNRESFHIQFNPHSKKWHFEYYPRPYDPTEAERYYPEEEGINKFCRYIELLKW
jgi:hypothetical protein